MAGLQTERRHCGTDTGRMAEMTSPYKSEAAFTNSHWGPLLVDELQSGEENSLSLHNLTAGTDLPGQA